MISKQLRRQSTRTIQSKRKLQSAPAKLPPGTITAPGWFGDLVNAAAADPQAFAQEMTLLGVNGSTPGRALIYCETALRALEHALPADGPAHLTVLNALQSLYGRLGRYYDAEQTQIRMIQIQRQFGQCPPEAPHLAIVLLNHAETLIELGRKVEAEFAMSEALEFHRQYDTSPGDLKDAGEALAEFYRHVLNDRDCAEAVDALQDLPPSIEFSTRQRKIAAVLTTVAEIKKRARGLIQIG